MGSAAYNWCDRWILSIHRLWIPSRQEFLQWRSSNTTRIYPCMSCCWFLVAKQLNLAEARSARSWQGHISPRGYRELCYALCVKTKGWFLGSQLTVRAPCDSVFQPRGRHYGPGPRQVHIELPSDPPDVLPVPAGQKAVGQHQWDPILG